MNFSSPSNSFLEVTINSTKLGQLLEDITLSLRTQDKRIKSFQEQYKRSTQAINTQIRSDRKYIRQQLQKTNSRINLANKQTNVYISCVDRHLEQYKRENQMKIQLLNNKISKNTEIFVQRSDQIRLNIQREASQRKQSFTKWETQLNSRLQTFDEQVKTFESNISDTVEKLREFVFNQIQHVKQQNPSSKSKQEKQKINKNFSQNKYLTQKQTIKYASISAKLRQLQNKLKEKQNAPINKIIYAKNSQKKYQKDLQNRQILQSNQQVTTKIQQQLTSIESFINSKLKFIAKDAQILKTKLVILEERFASFGRKFDKELKQSNELKQKVKTMQAMKIDQKLIDSLRYQIDKCIKRTQDMVEIKCNKDIFEKQRIKMAQKLSIIHQNIVERAEKSQVKKAILFLEDKIKDIIMLIANEQNNEKDGTITKLPLKCLSCEKDVDPCKQIRRVALKSATRSPLEPNSQNYSLRTMSNKIKRRMRVSHNSQSSYNF